VHQELLISTFSNTPGKGKMLCIVGSEVQPSPPIFVASGEGLIAVAFQALLRRPDLPLVKRDSPDGHCVFYQDWGPCHAALTTRHFLEARMSIYWPPDFWPLSLPYLHPLEYSI